MPFCDGLGVISSSEMLFTKGKRLSATAASVVVCLISEVDLTS